MKLGQDDDDDDDKVDGTVDDGMELAGIRFNRFRNKGRGWTCVGKLTFLMVWVNLRIIIEIE